MTARDRLVGATILAGSIGLLAASCSAAPPAGPQVMVLPGSDKTLAQFAADDSACRRWAAQRIGVPPSEEPAPTTPEGTAASGASPAVPPEAAVGSTLGAGSREHEHWSVQDRYDVAYMQCMYTTGNQVPVPQSFGAAVGRDTATAVGDVPEGIPPPPEGDPPPPPPGEVR